MNEKEYFVVLVTNDDGSPIKWFESSSILEAQSTYNQLISEGKNASIHKTNDPKRISL